MILGVFRRNGKAQAVLRVPVLFYDLDVANDETYNEPGNDEAAHRLPILRVPEQRDKDHP